MPFEPVFEKINYCKRKGILTDRIKVECRTDVPAESVESYRRGRYKKERVRRGIYRHYFGRFRYGRYAFPNLLPRGKNRSLAFRR